jgi:integrase
MAEEKARVSHRGIFEKVPGSGEWWIRYADATARIRREKAGTKSRAIALYQKRKTEVLQRKKLPETLRGNPITFARIAADALNYSRAHKRNAQDDEERMKLLLHWFGNVPADSLTAQQIEHMLTSEACERNWKPATVNRYKALLLTYRIALENGKVQGNPVRLVRRLREDNAVDRYLKDDEEARLRATVQPRRPERWAEVVFAINTGLRASEQARAQWEDVDYALEPPQLRVALTKKGPVRFVPLNKAAVQALETTRNFSNGSGRIFTQKPYRMWFEIALKAAAIQNFTWHCLRHTFASRLVMAGVDIRTVAELMGHKSLQMTMRYAHLAPQHNAAAVAKLDKGVSNVAKASDATDTKTSTSAAPAARGKLIEFPQVPVVQKVAVKPGP